MGERNLTALHLDVYDTKRGPWNPDHGDVDIPDDWDFLPTGNAFVTRRVKASGPYWISWRPRGKHRPHRRRLGLWAPKGVIGQAMAAADQTAERRQKSQEQGARHRARAEDRYRAELAEEIVAFLDFAPAHRELAKTIGHDAAAQAAVVGSGRVGRTQSLSLEDRAVLAARAWIRHQYTDYHQRLDSAYDRSLEGGLYGADLLLDELDYREIRGDANDAVDRFLTSHRSCQARVES